MISRLFKWIKRHPVLSLFTLAVLYLVVGATAPFYYYKPVMEETKAAVETGSFYQQGEGADRAMILETNQSAWEERMRLMNLAQERIILSTFDFRDGESPRDLMAVMLHKADQGVKVKILVDGFSGLVRMEPNKLFYALSSHPNIEIKIYNELNPLLPWKTQGRMHDKYVIVDDYGYILGGRNTFDYFIGSYPADSRSHDREVLVYNTAHGTAGSASSSLYQVEEYFNSVWNLDVSALFHDSRETAEKSSVKNAAAMLRERYKVMVLSYPELLDRGNGQPPGSDAASIGNAESFAHVSGQSGATGEAAGQTAAAESLLPQDTTAPNCGTLPGQPACPALPMDSGVNDDAFPLSLTVNQADALNYYQQHTVPAGRITLVSNPATIYSKEPVVFYTMASLMKDAKKRVMIHTPYAVFNDYMYDTMEEITDQVSVTMMVNSIENGDNFFASSDYPRHRDKLSGTGMEILEYDGGLSYHGKSVIIDDQLCAVGSYNFDIRSTYLDTELMLVIQSPELTAQLETYMASYEKDCRRLLADGTYEIPPHVSIAPVPLYKRIARKVTGFLMQPFRFLI